jgi:predicted transcriptional regulator
MATESAPTAATGTQARALEKKWGKAAIDAGYTVIPVVMLKYQNRLGLKPVDLNVLLQVLSYWWKEGGLPRPSKKSLAAALGVDITTIRRRLVRLEAAGFLHRVARRTATGRNQANVYDPSGLIAKLKPFADEELAEIQKRKLRKLHQMAGKKPTPLKVVK